jgi:hypothetical protein
MRDLTLTIPVGVSRRKVSGSGSLSVKTLNLSLLCGIALFGLVYLFQVNAMGTKGYDIRGLEQQVREVQEQQKNLQMEASNLQSIDLIETHAKQLNFVPSTNVTYLKDSDFAINR